MEHFAGRLVEYLVTNITAWDKPSIAQLVNTTLMFMSPTNGDRYAEFHRHFRRTIRLEGRYSLFEESIYAIWQKLAPFRDIARGKLRSIDPNQNLKS